MIISFLNMKGGAGKSTLARAVATELVKNGWETHMADTDNTQQTSFQWSSRRAENEIEPAVEVALYGDAKSALKAAKTADALVIDGKAFADKQALEIAKNSDLIVIPTGIAMDDLEPSLKFASELVTKKVDKAQILFVVTKVPDSGDKEAMNTRASIKAWGFEVASGWIPLKTSASKAMDSAGEMADQAVDMAGEMAEDAMDTAGDVAEGAMESASDMAEEAVDTVSDKAEELKASAEESLQEKSKELGLQ